MHSMLQKADGAYPASFTNLIKILVLYWTAAARMPITFFAEQEIDKHKFHSLAARLYQDSTKTDLSLHQ